MSGSLSFRGNSNRNAKFDATPIPGVNGSDRQIYVSAAGNDSTGDGSLTNPYLTINKAMTQMRDGFGDRLYLRRGDTFSCNTASFGNTGLYGFNLSGASSSRPIMFTAYGTGNRPIVTASTGACVQNAYRTTISNVWVVGLEFTGSPYDGSSTEINGIAFLWVCSNILVEDCYIHNFTQGVIFQGSTDYDDPPTNSVPWNSNPRHTNMKLRGCTIADIYYQSTDNRGQGNYNTNCDGLLIEQVAFVDCGWIPSDLAHAGTQKHALYVHAGRITGDGGGAGGAGGSTDVTVKNCCCIGGDGFTIRPGGTITGNVLTRSMSGVQVGMGDTGQIGGITFSMTDNVVVELDTYSSAVTTIGIAIGNVGSASTCARNIVAGMVLTPSTTDARAFWFRHPDFNYDGSAGDNVVGAALTMHANIFYHAGTFYCGGYDVTYYDGQTTWTKNDLTVDANTFGDQFLLNSEAMLAKHTFTGNNFYAPTGTNWFNIGGSSYPFSTAGANNDWKEKSGDTTATSSAISYAAPTRTVATYATSIGLADLDALKNAFKSRSLANWNNNYTAQSIASYIRAGFT